MTFTLITLVPQRIQFKTVLLLLLTVSEAPVTNAEISARTGLLHQKRSLVSIRPHSLAHSRNSSTQRPTLPSWPSIRDGPSWLRDDDDEAAHAFHTVADISNPKFLTYHGLRFELRKIRKSAPWSINKTKVADISNPKLLTYDELRFELRKIPINRCKSACWTAEV